jgi:hypothetical protein
MALEHWSLRSHPEFERGKRLFFFGRKAKPRYMGRLGPMVVLCRTQNGSFTLQSSNLLDGPMSNLHFVAFHQVSCNAHSRSSIPVMRLVNRDYLVRVNADEDIMPT